VTFFRSLGGAVGVSVLGAVLATHVKDLIAENIRALGPDGAQAARALQDGSGTSVLDVGALPPQLADIVRHAYGDATGRIFLIAAGAAVVSLLAVLFIREVPLRTTVAKTDDGDAVQADLAAATAPGAGSPGVVPASDDPAERAAVVALDVITSAERTAREREREASERVHAAATVIRQMRADVADLFTRVDHQIAELESTLPVAVDPGSPAAALMDAQRPDGELVDELRRYELSVLSASQRTADHLREAARAEADELLATAREEEDAVRHRIADLEAVEHRLLAKVREGLSNTPTPPAVPPTTPHRVTPTHDHQVTPTHDHAANGYPAPHEQSHEPNGYPPPASHEAHGHSTHDHNRQAFG
jgi:hypothetical protein